MIDGWALLAEHAVGAAISWVWTNVVGVPKARPRSDPFSALMSARHAEIVRLASTPMPTTVPGLSDRFEGERLVLSMPVFLYEDVSTRRLYPPASKAGRKLVWEHRASSRKRITLSVVDHGTLRFTNRRFEFAGVKRQRKFPLAELTHLSASWSSIALAARGHHGISYFRGLNASRLRFSVMPEAGDCWEAFGSSFNLMGTDLKEILSIMNGQSPSASS